MQITNYINNNNYYMDDTSIMLKILNTHELIFVTQFASNNNLLDFGGFKCYNCGSMFFKAYGGFCLKLKTNNLFIITDDKYYNNDMLTCEEVIIKQIIE